MPKIEFDEDIFPYVIECPDCPYGTTAEITREEASEAVPPGIEATPKQAVDRALLLRDWYRDPRTMWWMCSSCLKELD